MTNVQQEALNNQLLQQFNQEWEAGDINPKAGYSLNPGAGMTGWENPYSTALQNIWASLTEPFDNSNPDSEYNLQGKLISTTPAQGNNPKSLGTELEKHTKVLEKDLNKFINSHGDLFIIVAMAGIFVLIVAMGGK